MDPRYLQLGPGQQPPSLEAKPYRLIIVADAEVPDEWRKRVANWIWSIGARYVIAWGCSCEEWHDSVDWANLEAFDFGQVPDKDHIMTTWHANEPLSEAFWFAGFCAVHPDLELSETIILHISDANHREEMLAQYFASQVDQSAR
ncbi:MAG: hypothetical protein AAGB23_07620 [Pseudomonadota bacterium]